MLTVALRALRDSFAEAFRVVQPRSVKEWAEANIVLPSTVTQNDGQYSTDHCSYVDEALEDFRDPELEETTWCWAAQVFKSTTLMVGMGYKIDQHPENILWLMPNTVLVKSFAETKWLPMIEASEAINRHKVKVADRFKKLEQQFDNCILTFLASGSQKNLKGRSGGLMVIDEVDDVEDEWNKKGMSAISMAESRTKSFVGSKIFKAGTPTVVTAPSWIGFLAGDQRLRFVDCPHCSQETTIEFNPEYTKQYFPNVPATKVVWGEEAGFASAKMADGEWDLDLVFQTARLRCPHCSALWTEGDKVAAGRRGRWKATNPNPTKGKRSRRLPSIYSPHPKTSIGALAVKFLSTIGRPGGLRNFLNEELALPWQPKGTTVTKSDIRLIVEHSPAYVLGEIPRQNLALIAMTIDVQQAGFWWVHRAYFGDGSTALVDYGQAIAWKELLELMARSYPILGTDRHASPLFAFIDSGYRAKRTGGVYEFCLGDGAGRFFPMQGRSQTGHGFLKAFGESDQDYKGQPFKLIQFNDDIFKYELYLQKLKNSGAGKWWLPRNIGKDYEAQLTDEYLTEKEGWKTREDNNHLGDAEKMQLIVPGVLKDRGFALLADRVSGPAPVDTPPSS